MEAKKLYDEWKALKSESINYQRAGADGYMSEEMMKRDSFVFNRIKEIESDMFPLLRQRYVLTFNRLPVEDTERQQDSFYTNGYLVDWIKISENIKIENGLVTGQVIYAKTP